MQKPVTASDSQIKLEYAVESRAARLPRFVVVVALLNGAVFVALAVYDCVRMTWSSWRYETITVTAAANFVYNPYASIFAGVSALLGAVACLAYSGSHGNKVVRAYLITQTCFIASELLAMVTILSNTGSQGEVFVGGTTQPAVVTWRGGMNSVIAISAILAIQSFPAIWMAVSKRPINGSGTNTDTLNEPL